MILRALLALPILTGLSPFAAGEESLRWLHLPDSQMQVSGLPWYGENGGELFRLPAKRKDSFPKAVWELAQSPSGGRIRFRSNTRSLSIQLEYPHPPDMQNMHAFGQTGVDLYIDGVYRDTAVADRDSKAGHTQQYSFFKDEPATEREITLYLPMYIPAKVIGIGVDTEAQIQTPAPFALEKPIVFYGTSITQGGCASRSGMSYEAILGRMLNVDFVNLGFSGNGKGEAETAAAVADIDAAAFVLDFAQNNVTAESLRQVYLPFVEIIRTKHPQTPLLVITPIYSAREAWAVNERLEGMRELIRQAAAKRIVGGDRNIEIVEGTDLIGPSRGDGLVDGTHPNDLGFQWMAEGLSDRIAKILGLQRGARR